MSLKKLLLFYLSKEFGCSVISTGDSYLAPQILEINYK